MQTSYFVSMVLVLLASLVPDAIVLLPLFWVNLGILRAANNRVVIASMLGLLTVALYGGLSCLIWPEAMAVVHFKESIAYALTRSYCFRVFPLWMLVTSGVLSLLGLWAQWAHFKRFTTANVRTQTRLLLITPAYWVTLASTLFPAANGSCLMALLWATSLYYPILYVATYGFPKLPSISHSNPYQRSYKRRRRRR